MNLPDIGQYNNESHFIEALFLYSSIGIIVTNKQGEILVANPFLEKLFGYTREEMLGQKIELLIPRRFHEKHVKHRDSFNSHPSGRPMGLGMDLFAVKKDGTEFPVEVSLGYYSLENNSYAIAFINDITPRKQSEELITKLNDELENKVEERTHQLTEAMLQLQQSKEELDRALNKEIELNDLKSKFVSIASHEFRTPLSTVLSSVYLLEKYTTTEEQPKRQKHIERIISSVHMLTDILNDFLSVGKIEEGKVMVRLSQLNIIDFVSTTINEIKGIQKKGQQIVHRHSGEPVVALDPSLLKHIIINLLSNAIKFSPEDSLIAISTNYTGLQLELRIADKGIGVSKQDQEHLFERFFRGENASAIQGTGLGLHIVAKYVSLLNGTITCSSDTDQGTEMTIVFKNPGTDE